MIEQTQTILQEAFQQDSLSLYFLMFSGGLLAALTPCTYPILPLTVGYIGNQATSNRMAAFYLSLALVTGLATVYAVLGVIIAAVGGTFGSIMGNGWALYTIATFYLIMGLFLLDVFQFPVPSFFSWLQVKSANRKGILGAFVIGCVSGLIVGPCTGPILAVALGAIALTLKRVYGLVYAWQIVKSGILLFLFGLGQGTLILLAGIFTGFISKLPKAGAWMETVKRSFALLIIIAASLLFVFVGQNTDFPNLTRFLAGTNSSAAPIPARNVAQRSHSPGIGEPSANLAPDFTLAALGKEHITLSHLKDKKGVVLAFFATWCVSCVKEVPEIKQFATEAKKKNVVVYGIDYKQPTEIVEGFVKSQKINYMILLDLDGTVATKKYGVKGIPHFVGINAKGRIIYRGTALPDNKTEFINNLQQGL